MSKRQSKRRSIPPKKLQRRKTKAIEKLLSGSRFKPAFYAVVFLLCLIAYHGMFDNWMFNDDFRYLQDAVMLHNPEWHVVEVKGGEEEAAELRPCLYIRFSKKDRVIISKKFE
jgi:hypothetical protein